MSKTDPDKSLPKITSRKIAARSRIFAIEQIDLMFSNGEQRVYERMAGSGRGGVMIVPFTNTAATFGGQAMGVLCILGFGFVLTYAFLTLLNIFAPVRASDAIQKKGLDAEEIGIEAYPEF